ncbi:ribosomal protein L1, partial [Coprinopsis marcescibilis]
MATDEIIDQHVSTNQCRLAIDALHSYESKKQEKLEESELISGKEPNIWLNITVKKIPAGHRMKPVKIPIVYPLVDPRTTPICLITKDPQREYKDLLETQNIKFISRVVGIEKLKGKFKPYEARRALLKENGMFLADERVVTLLPKLLGKKWFEAKKQPIPVCLKRKDLKAELERAISSTYMNQNQGTCTSVKIATLSQKPAQVLANLQKALPTIIANIKDGWENIQSLHIKTNSSVSLPIWSCSLDSSEGGRWHNLEAEAESVNGEDSEAEVSDSMVVDAPVEKKSAAKAGRKRDSNSDEEMKEELPRKRSKNEK